MELLIVVGVIGAIILFAAIQGFLLDQKEKNKAKEYLKNQYGSYTIKNLGREEIKRISKRFLYMIKNENKNVFYIDDITWNDCDMDTVFSTINHTQSATGAEYLYQLLRIPVKDVQELAEREEMISYFQSVNNSQLRLTLQMILKELGEDGKYSIFDYINYLSKYKKGSNTKHIIMCVLFLLSIIMIFFNAAWGVVGFIIISFINIFSYTSTKGEIIPNLTGISYVRRLIECSDKIDEELNGFFLKNVDTGYKMEIPHKLQVEYNSRQEKRKRFSSFMHQSKMVEGIGKSNGNPIQLILDYARMLTHIDLINYYNMMQHLCEYRQDVVELLGYVGELDAMIAIGAFRESKKYCIPEFVSHEDGICMKKGYHMLIENAIENDYFGERGAVITGSNASGKSTFLKTVAINVILAMTIHTTMAEQFRTPMFRIYSSMSLRDNLSVGDSYYMVEIKALKRILDAIEQREDLPILCFVDEVLRGTNTIERIAASTQILKYMAKNNMYCFAATHDIELTYLLEKDFDNYHFKEEIEGKDIVFSYKLLSGRAESRNAIRLLAQLGFEEEIIQQAEEMANHLNLAER